jgi:hypothetical protein
MGHGNKADRVRPADRSGDQGTRRVSAGRGPQKSDGFLHVRRLHLRGAVGANTIMPSQWLRWVWDQEQGEQPPEFTSEKQAKRILSLLIGQANVVAFTLTHGPQYYEPLSMRTRSKEIASRSSTSGAAATSRASRSILRVGSRSLMRGLTGSRPSTSMAPRAAGSGSSNWLMRTRIPLHGIRPLLTGSPPRLATSMPTGWPVAPRGKSESSTRRLLLAATIHARAAPAKNSNAATGRRTSRCIRPPKSALLPRLRPYGLHSFGCFNFLTIRAYLC